VREEKQLANEMGKRYKNALERSKPSVLKDLNGSSVRALRHSTNCHKINDIQPNDDRDTDTA
jgi:hypothetical protein